LCIIYTCGQKLMDFIQTAGNKLKTHILNIIMLNKGRKQYCVLTDL